MTAYNHSNIPHAFVRSNLALLPEKQGTPTRKKETQQQLSRRSEIRSTYNSLQRKGQSHLTISMFLWVFLPLVPRKELTKCVVRQKEEIVDMNIATLESEK